MTREEALKRVKGYLTDCLPADCYGEAEEIMEALEQELKTEWIPVSERLPEDRESVLFSTKTDMVFEGKYLADDTDSKWYAESDDTFVRNNVVTAWMPLPTPYKAESEDKNAGSN